MQKCLEMGLAAPAVSSPIRSPTATRPSHYRKDMTKKGECTEAGRAGERVATEVASLGTPPLSWWSMLKAW